MIWRGTIIAVALVASVSPLLAEILTPVRTIRATQVISAEDLRVVQNDVPGALSELSDIVGKEARRNLYAGRPIRESDISEPALVERNQPVSLLFERGGLRISTEGRALERGGVGDLLRVLNLSSRNTVVGRVDENGVVRVGG